MKQQEKAKSNNIGTIIFIGILCSLFLGVGFYDTIIRPKNLLHQVAVDFETTKQALGEPSLSYLAEGKCDKFQFVSCQEIEELDIEVLYIWHKGLDLNIVAGFDGKGKLKFKRTAINEQL